ncbi:MAG: DUF3373 family protein [Campylobacterota bacterium]|nr:DUF3373 family protein [Campylobacterota bacterium]
MKKIVVLSVVAATMAFGATSDEIADLQKQIDKLKTQVSKNKAQSSGDNIKWGVDLRTAVDNINYDMANGTTAGNDSLMSMRLWLNMAYAADSKNIFKGQLSMNKAFGADFGINGELSSLRGFGMGSLFDWTGNEALSDNNLRVRQAYWLYMGDDAFGQGVDWTFSIGRRPSGNGFLANLSQDLPASSPLGHVINVEFDGLSSKLDFSKWTGISGMSIKACVGRGSTNAVPLFYNATPYAEDPAGLDSIDLAGIIFVPYDDGQFIVKSTYYRAFNVPGMDPIADVFTPDGGSPLNPSVTMGQTQFQQYGDMDGAALSVLVDGVTDDGYGADVKLFGSFAWTKSYPEAGKAMFGSTEDQTGTSYWFGAYLPVGDGEGENYGTVGLEYNHGDEYWRPFTYAEDTMIGSKIAARGDAWEINYTYHFTKALSLQARYVDISYDYTGSQGFFGNLSGASQNIDDVKTGAATFTQLGGTYDAATGTAGNLGVVTGNLMASGMDQATAQATAGELAGAALFLPNIVESAQDFRFYLRYRF